MMACSTNLNKFLHLESEAAISLLRLEYSTHTISLSGKVALGTDRSYKTNPPLQQNLDVPRYYVGRLNILDVLCTKIQYIKGQMNVGTKKAA